jgi:hypothetical protein
MWNTQPGVAGLAPRASRLAPRGPLRHASEREAREKSIPRERASGFATAVNERGRDYALRDRRVYVILYVYVERESEAFAGLGRCRGR